MQLTLTLAFLLLFCCAGAQAQLVPAAGVCAEIKRSVDLGRGKGTAMLHNLVLQLIPPAENKEALASTIRLLHDPKSASYHKWLTAAEFMRQLAIRQSSIDFAKTWLQSQGFTVSGLSPNRSAILFYGSVSQVESAFHTTMHRFHTTDGRMHLANVAVPLMPDQLASVATGLISLDDFPPHHVGSVAGGPNLVGGDGGSNQNLGARDLQVIYSINSVHANGFSGQGMTVAVIEDSDLYSIGDWLAYRHVFGLTKAFPKGNLMAVNPAGSYPCPDPGASTADGEATLDAEVATAAARMQPL